MVNTPEPDVIIRDLFEAAERVKLPKLNSNPEPKSLKQLKQEQEQDRLRKIAEHERRFNETPLSFKPVISDADFMAREEVAFDEEEQRRNASKVFQADLDSLRMKSKPSETSNFSLMSPYEQLYIPRKVVRMSKEDRARFQKANTQLDRALDERDIKRIANVQKRMDKNERIELKMVRRSAADVRRKIQKKEFHNLFGFFNLVPLTLTKTTDSAEERKHKIIDRFQDFLYDFDYAKRAAKDPRQAHAEEYKKLYDEWKETHDFLAAHSALPDSLKQRNRSTAAPRKEKEDAQPTTSSPIDPGKAWEDEFVRASEMEAQQKREEAEAQERLAQKKRKEEKAARKEKLRRKQEAEEARKRREEAERVQMERRERLEAERREQLARENEERRRRAAEEHAEWQRQRAEREQAEEEARRIFEENRLLQIEESRRREAEAQKIRNEKELERMREQLAIDMELKTRQDEQIRLDEEEVYVVNDQVPSSAINLQKHWYLQPCHTSRKRKGIRERYHAHYNMPALPEHRDIERIELLASFRAKKTAAIIPQENSASTNVYHISMPKRAEPIDPKGPACQKEVKKVSEMLKEMVKEKKGVTLVPTNEDEQDYEETSLVDLKKHFDYPFHLSDGMYWPVLHTMPENSVRSHVEALAQCNSFSGKFASHLLLTATSADDDYEKKFDDDYNDCDGEWADYAMKPGRFSNRIGFRAKHGQSNEAFEVQREKAVTERRAQFLKENEAYDKLWESRQEYDKNQNQEAFKSQLNVHLGQLVADARLDEYSMKTSYDFARTVHPGTRDTHLDPRWHNHGYRFFMHTRDSEYCLFMNQVCANYESLLPGAGEQDKFIDWCLTPMLTSLYYQAFHDCFNMFPRDVMNKLDERRKKYLAVLKSNRFVLKDVRDVCRLTESDAQQWTILLDQLVAHFRDFPPVSALIYDRNCSLYDVAFAAINELMNGEFKDYSNMWTFRS